jgi:hypothetical protein
MNVKRKQAAVNKYAPMLQQGVTLEELDVLLGNDEKNYSADEITEIRTALIGSAAEQPVKPASKLAAKPVEIKKPVVGYEEWRCEIKVDRDGDGKIINRKAEKVKLLRPNVKITEQEADTLNNGALHSPRQDYVLMYFKPE